MLHKIFARTCRDCSKILAHTSCFKQISSLKSKSISLLLVDLKEICGKSFKSILRSCAFLIEATHRLGKMTLSSISAGQHHWTILINMSRLIVFGGKLNKIHFTASRYSTIVRRGPVHMVRGVVKCGSVRPIFSTLNKANLRDWIATSGLINLLKLD